jgi:hypothetical protein
MPSIPVRAIRFDACMRLIRTIVSSVRPALSYRVRLKEEAHSDRSIDRSGE